MGLSQGFTFRAGLSMEPSRIALTLTEIATVEFVVREQAKSQAFQLGMEATMKTMLDFIVRSRAPNPFVVYRLADDCQSMIPVEVAK